jgi:hypothetical protein
MSKVNLFSISLESLGDITRMQLIRTPSRAGSSAAVQVFELQDRLPPVHIMASAVLKWMLNECQDCRRFSFPIAATDEDRSGHALLADCA